MSESTNPNLDPAIIVIFGITGDLSKRYLLPSLYHLTKENLLNEKTRIVGVTRGSTTTDDLFKEVELCVNEVDKTCDPEVLRAMQERTTMFQMDLNDPTGYDSLLAELNAIEEEGICMNRLYYLSIPPQAYPPVIRLLGERGLNKSCQHDKAQTRLMVEKPFGFDLNSAESLINETSEFFSEEQTFRIDHYMAKEAVQNILTFRFKNPIFEAVWNKDHIASIEISAKEKIGIEGRAVFYDQLGALRDFIQSHLLQILGILTMDKPEGLDSDHIHKNKQAALEHVQPVPEDQVSSRAIRGQYEGYRDEVHNPESSTETFASVTVYMGCDRWEGVPIRLLTGKAMDERKTEVKVTFHGSSDTENNELRFRIQPNEGIELDLATKKPGFTYEMQTTAMDFSYSQSFAGDVNPGAYERVLVDAIRGDHTLFASGPEILASWRIVQPVLDAWSKDNGDLISYKPDSNLAEDKPQ